MLSREVLEYLAFFFLVCAHIQAQESFVIWTIQSRKRRRNALFLLDDDEENRPAKRLWSYAYQ